MLLFLGSCLTKPAKQTVASEINGSHIPTVCHCPEFWRRIGSSSEKTWGGQCRRGQCRRGSRLQQKLWKRRTLPPPPVKKKCGIIYTHIYVCVYVYHKPTISETLIFGQLWGTRATSSPMCGQVSIDMFVYTYNNYSSKNLGYVEHLK